MFQAIGVHGPELSAFAQTILSVILVLMAFLFLSFSSRNYRPTLVGLGVLVLAVAVVRILLQSLPNIQPVTVACLLVGSHLGAKRGIAFAVLVTILSNAVIGDGWWTLFQAIGWAGVAMLGSTLNFEKNGSLHVLKLSIVAGASAFLFGAITTLSLFEPGMTFVHIYTFVLQGLPFDALHALGNIAFAIWLAPTLHRFLQDVVLMQEGGQTAGDVVVVHG